MTKSNKKNRTLKAFKTNNIQTNSIHPTTTPNQMQMTGGGSSTGNIFARFIHSVWHVNSHVMYLNNSKFFAGIVMILLNVGSKFITIQFSRSTEEYMKYTVSKQLLVFAMAWMGTRDIYTALALTAIFTILSEHLFNEESILCVVPEQYRVLNKLNTMVDDNEVNDTEIAAAHALLEKVNKNRQRQMQREAFAKFDFQKYNYDSKS
jgi:hypothetical protein